MNIKRTSRFSIASVLLAMTIVALVGRTSLDHVRLAQLRQDLALHDSVEHQRSIVAQREFELAALKSRLPPDTNVQFRNRWVLPGASNNDEQVTRIAITPIPIGLRLELVRIRTKELHLMREQAILEEQENKLRSKVEDRIPKM